jgi:hypothetical protein
MMQETGLTEQELVPLIACGSQRKWSSVSKYQLLDLL